MKQITLQIQKTQKCRQLAPLMERHANGQTASDDAHILVSHLSECDACRREWAQWQITQDLTTTLRTSEVPESQRGWNDLQTRLTPVPKSPSLPFPTWAKWSGAVGTVAAAAICFALFRPSLPTPSIDDDTSSASVQAAVTSVAPAQSHPEISSQSLTNVKAISEETSRQAVKIQKAGLQKVTASVKRETPVPQRAAVVKRETPRLSFASLRKETPAQTSVSHSLKAEQGTGDTGQEPENRAVVSLGVDGEPPVVRDSTRSFSGQRTADAPRYVMGSIGNSNVPLTPASHNSTELQAW
jgi:anti-sigma factor RsiW